MSDRCAGPTQDQDQYQKKKQDLLRMALTYVESKDAFGAEDYRKKSGFPIQEIRTLSKYLRSFEPENI